MSIIGVLTGNLPSRSAAAAVACRASSTLVAAANSISSTGSVVIVGGDNSSSCKTKAPATERSRNDTNILSNCFDIHRRPDTVDGSFSFFSSSSSTADSNKSKSSNSADNDELVSMEVVHKDHGSSVAILTMQRPPANSLSLEMCVRTTGGAKTQTQKNFCVSYFFPDALDLFSLDTNAFVVAHSANPPPFFLLNPLSFFLSSSGCKHCQNPSRRPNNRKKCKA